MLFCFFSNCPQTNQIYASCIKHPWKSIVNGTQLGHEDMRPIVCLLCRMDEMMKGERGWRELQILGDKGRRFSGMWDGPSTGSTRDDPASPISSTNGIFIESSDEDWNQEEVFLHSSIHYFLFF